MKQLPQRQSFSGIRLPIPGQRPRLQTFRLLIVSLALVPLLHADPKVPDLTRGEKPALAKKMKKPLSGNLGPTGLIGWVFHEGTDSNLSRQILITEVAKGSPAFGIIREGDVILGASGTSTSPVNFSTDARKSFAQAIAEAEARNPALLHLKVWRDGITTTPAITLEHLGSYAPTAPYNCPKSHKIIERALAYLETNELKVDRFGLNMLALLACNDDRFPGREARLAKAREWVTELIPRKDHYDGMISDQVETFSKVAWNRTYHLIAMAEYYLATGDNPSKDGITLLMAIDAHAQTIARGQSMFGTMGHQFAKQGADGSVHGPYAVGYGPVNATGLAAFLALTLARDCQLPNPETNTKIEEGIERAATFFSYYAHRGAIPYGEHGPWTKSHSANGKNGMAAAAFARLPGREAEAKFFSQMAIASGTERMSGHGGAFFNYLWNPIGANAGGEAASAAYFKQISWHLDLSRTWDGGFYYNDYANPGYHGPTFGKASLLMSSPALLTYAFGLKKLHITGKEWNARTRLSPSEVEEAHRAGHYRPAERSRDQLIGDLASFSVVVRNRAAQALATDKEDSALRAQLQEIALRQDHPSRRGAVRALAMFEHADCATILTQLFHDQDPYIKEEAIDAFSNMPLPLQEAQVDVLLKMAAELKRPPLKVHDEDPMNSSLISLTQILFDKKGVLGTNLDAVKKHSSMEQLYAAMRASATLPSGGVRGMIKNIYPHLSVQDIRALSDTLIELIEVEAPADAMFAEGIRYSTAQLLLDHRFDEGVQASLNLYKIGGRWTRVVMIKSWGEVGPSLKSHKLWPQIETALKSYSDDKFKNEAVKALAAINKPETKTETFRTLKSGSALTYHH